MFHDSSVEHVSKTKQILEYVYHSAIRQRRRSKILLRLRLKNNCIEGNFTIPPLDLCLQLVLISLIGIAVIGEFNIGLMEPVDLAIVQPFLPG